MLQKAEKRGIFLDMSAVFGNFLPYFIKSGKLWQGERFEGKTVFNSGNKAGRLLIIADKKDRANAFLHLPYRYINLLT